MIINILFIHGCTIIFPIIAPFNDLPEPSGPYAVATCSTSWTDSSREETFTEKHDFRRLAIKVWYPTIQEKTVEPELYVENPELRLPAIANQLNLPISLIRHFDGVLTNSFVSDPRADFETVFPVILFSHGLSGMRSQNTSVMEELASHGYVILAPDHSYDANIAIFDDGEIAEYRAGNRRVLKGNRLEDVDLSKISIRVSDLSFIIDKIKENNLDPFLEGIPYDSKTIGVIGQSLGGATAISTMAMDERIQAAMILDGWYIPVPDSILSQGVEAPVFHLGQLEWSDENNYERMDRLMLSGSGPFFKLLIPNTQHTDFTDMPLFTPFSLLIGYTAIQDPIWLNDLIRHSAVLFFDTYLKAYDSRAFQTLISNEPETSSYIFIP
ncbi:dienelactone hydrolase family protein [bacterium]|nr:dienelactone hydrolase family protein [bacterium]